jgi:anti-sigma-K factor RskA
MISDDDLLLYYYRDGLDAAERARIAAALAEQPELARRLHGLVARLDAAASLPEVPVPAPTLQRWQAALECAASDRRAEPVRRTSFVQPRWQALAAAAAVAVIALVFGIQKSVTPTPAPTAGSETAAAANDPAAYENGLKWHLASTERRLASLEDATPEERARLVETIIGQNRIYALAAERAGEPQLARVLRAFTPVLESVADGHGQTSGSIEQLGFELRVMQARLKADAAAPTNTL